MMAMKRALGLSRRQDRQVVPQLFCSNMIADLAAARCVEAVLFDVVKLDFVNVHHRFHCGLPQFSSCGGKSKSRESELATLIVSRAFEAHCGATVKLREGRCPRLAVQFSPTFVRRFPLSLGSDPRGL